LKLQINKIDGYLAKGIEKRALARGRAIRNSAV
jgi:hypothetical protein